ncbi:MAG TPA: hypothetical protein VGK99_22300, partial [Acidobacteriota bacterium]
AALMPLQKTLHGSCAHRFSLQKNNALQITMERLIFGCGLWPHQVFVVRKPCTTKTQRTQNQSGFHP